MVDHKIKIFTLAIAFIAGCTKDKGLVDAGSDYPAEVSRIILSKCATSGCHNRISKEAAAGLSLTSWHELFEGSRNGPVVIPYRPDYSTLCFYTNAFPELGPTLNPRMPVNGSLSKDEYLVLMNWIAVGAPNSSGKLKYGPNNPSKKIYIINRLCDVVTVADAVEKRPFRYITVGKRSSIEFPFSIQMSPDNTYWLVAFFSPNGLIQKFNGASDEAMGEINLGSGSWSTFAISRDSRLAYFIDNSSPGKLVCANMETMQVVSHYSFSFVYPHGVSVHPQLKKLYIGTEYGNYIYVVDLSDSQNPRVTQKTIDGSNVPNEEFSNAPHYFEYSADGSMCFIGCEGSKDIRVLNTANDSLIKIIPLPASPAMLKFSTSSKHLFVSCPFDSLSFSNTIGSVNAISVPGLSLVKTINTGFQPYGLGINEDDQTIAVANANTHIKGPSPHHVGGCAGRNGYLTFIDMRTFSLLSPRRYELAVFPFEVAVKTR